jgi:hypothetical protein
MHSDDLIKNADKLNGQTRAAYKAVESKLDERLKLVRNVLEALGPGGEAESRGASIPKAGALPPIYMIREYLKECGKPASQSDIVRGVGERRAEKYPHLSRPYGDVWKSLEYHDRHNRDVVCVKQDGERIVRAELVPKDRHPRVKGGAGDRPEFYDGPNVFWFRAEISE